MMTRLFTRAILFALLIQTGSVVPSLAQGGRPIQFSEPRSDKVNTNLNRLGQGLSRLDRLESELSRPFDFIAPGNSMQGGFLAAPLPAPPPVVNNPRVKELIDRKRDLPFMTPEEIFQIESPEARYKAPELTPDGRDRNTLRPMERVLLDRDVNLDPGRNFTHPGSNPNAPNDRFQDANENPNLRGSSDLERNLRNLVGHSSPFDNNNNSSRSTADFFGLGENQAQKFNKRTDSELQRIEQFKQLYDFGTRPEGVSAADASRFSNPYLESSFYDPPRAMAPAPSSLAGGSSAAGASIFGGAPSAYTPPSPAPAPAPVRTPAPSPFMSVPKRPF
jgi:hypothetical protein